MELEHIEKTENNTLKGRVYKLHRRPRIKMYGYLVDYKIYKKILYVRYYNIIQVGPNIYFYTNLRKIVGIATTHKDIRKKTRIGR